ncbi:hypothetical protein B0H13DRAFT_517251 [Mycena leptocephala]|nr:hypothetical protein B0H13DRAFT_517251 [Mycena leptocephala]
MIFSAPPHPVRFKPWRKYKNAKVIVMAEWEPSEVVIGSTIHTTFQPELNEGNLTAVAELLRWRFDECGPVARHLFADVPAYKNVVQNKKYDLEWLDFARLEQMIKTPEDESHGLVLMSRQTPDLNPLGSDIPVYSILNRATMDSIFNRHLMQSADQLRKFGLLLSSRPSYASCLGWLFESFVHRHLSDPRFRGDTPLIIKKMRRDGNTFISNSSSSPVRLSLGRLDLTVFAPQSPPSSTTGLGSYFISTATKNPAYDSFFFLDVDSTGSPALDTGLHGCAVQASIASSHTCEPSGMADVTARFKSADVMSRDFIVVIPAGHQIKLEGISSTYLDNYDFWSMEVDTGLSTPTTPPKAPRVVGLTAPTAPNVPDIQMVTVEEKQSGGLNRIDKQLRLLSFV